jgi:AcrR family transcriptional regulator
MLLNGIQQWREVDRKSTARHPAAVPKRSGPTTRPTPRAPTSKPASARRLGVDERRTQLVELGRRLFTERPYDALSIDEIARAAGISRGLLYHYFPSKRDFYVAVVGDAAQRLLETTKLRPGLAPPEQAVERIDAYLDFVEGNAGPFVTLLRGGVGTDREVAAIVDGTREALVTSVLDTLGVAERPVFRIAMRGWVGLVEAVSLEWIERRRIPRDTVRTLLLGTLRACFESALALDPSASLTLRA